MLKFHRHVPGVPPPLRTLAAVTAAWAIVAACAVAAEVALWADAHPWAVILAGTILTIVMFVRRRTSRTVYEPHSVRLGRDGEVERPVPAATRTARNHQRPATSSTGHSRHPASEIVYWGDVRVGTLDEQGTFRPDH